MEPVGSIPHSQGLSNNSYPEPNQPNSPHWCSSRSILILSSHLRLGLPKDLFPVDFPVKIVKALLSSSILATWPAHLSLLDIIILTILVNGTNYEVPHCGAFFTPHSHPSWIQISYVPCTSQNCSPMGNRTSIPFKAAFLEHMPKNASLRHFELN